MWSILLAFHLALLVQLNFRGTNAQCKPRRAVKVTGRLRCRGSDISRALVSLDHKIGFMRNTLRSTTSSEDGSFTVEGVPHFESDGMIPKLSLHVQYFVNSEVANFWMRDGDEVPLEFKGDDISRGIIELDTDICGAHVSFYLASVDYHNRTGVRTEQKIVLRRDETANSSIPYADYKEVVFKPGFFWRKELAMHELAHVMRHYYDGDGGHFDADAEEFGSDATRIHDCETESNEGFAFNEGWALYWQGACMESNAEGDHTIEGNVAAALRRLEAACSRSTADMWEVLKENRGTIHSFSEYESKHKELFGCP